MQKRDCRGEALLSALIAMAVAAIVLPTLLLLLHNTTRLATAKPDHDEGLHARAELAEMFGSVDPVDSCASPAEGPTAARRDSCFRETGWAGASLISAPVLPTANPAGLWRMLVDLATGWPETTKMHRAGGRHRPDGMLQHPLWTMPESAVQV